MTDPKKLLKSHESDILELWLAKLDASGSRLNQMLTDEERSRYSREILSRLIQALKSGMQGQVEDQAFASLREYLSSVSASFAERGFSPSETATYVFSLKEAVFELYQRELKGEELVARTWEISTIVDQLGLYTFEAFSLNRERIIKSQAQALSELSTPVIQVWEGIIALPLVGSIDSMRAKEIMEKLLDAVIAYEADIVIIDITGVPVVDTQVANRLMRTVESVRLLGTRSIITGINPVIAQTLVQLGVDLSQLTTKASLRAGLQQAFRDLQLTVRPAGRA